MNYKEIIINELLKSKLTLGIAESVTGGMIASTFVDVPNASKVFKGGIVAYTDFAKKELLRVNGDTLDKYTAYSANVAREMAKGIRDKLKTDISISVTGHAGPFNNVDINEYRECKAYFCIIIVDKAYDFEITLKDEGKTNNRITIVSKIIEELFKLVYRPDKFNE
ncbi:putative competence-damage inducible protein CinA [Malacoplasma penetrans HF-2]|uniref:Competence-damage inducible protein CinA n=1 Tax=Malacoplasma penetrans (strain HF-2) TaxID=272633 RepID=Q8EVC6_MALP2|nr:CinA family protein [Malacoplasma penetrans]BAC44430.1 putative competence-damage inducible protein CinA [Malacoplasma penetrans HF-2]